MEKGFSCQAPLNAPYICRWRFPVFGCINFFFIRVKNILLFRNNIAESFETLFGSGGSEFPDQPQENCSSQPQHFLSPQNPSDKVSPDVFVNELFLDLFPNVGIAEKIIEEILVQVIKKKEKGGRG